MINKIQKKYNLLEYLNIKVFEHTACMGLLVKKALFFVKFWDAYERVLNEIPRTVNILKKRH